MCCYTHHDHVQYGWGARSYIGTVDVSLLFSFHVAEQVLDYFRDRFIAEVDAKAVYMELANKGIIDVGDQQQISATYDPVQSNQILHFCLKNKCTEDALRTVCDVMIRVKGNPKMKALGEDIKRKLGKCCKMS